MRGISLTPEQISARAEGFNEMAGRLPLLKRIHVHYQLSIPEGSRAPTDRALASRVGGLLTANITAGDHVSLTRTARSATLAMVPYPV